MIETSVSARSTPVSSRPTTFHVRNNTLLKSASSSFPEEAQHSALAIRFAHPAEAEIARILDFYGVRWQYEPTTFPLRTGENGVSIQSFTPDFYLPEHNIYIEMTTMRQSLVTRKNRKFRLLRELYPELNVKLLYRKDVEHILGRYSSSRESTESARALQQVIREEQIQRRAAEIAEALLAYERRHISLFALGESAVRTRDLIRDRVVGAGGNATCALISVSNYGPNGRACEVRLDSDVDFDGQAREVVVVADIVGTGLTALTAIHWLRAHGATSVRLISLLDRRSSRLVNVPLELAGFTVTSHWHVGAGMGQCERYRDLADIHTLAPLPPSI